MCDGSRFGPAGWLWLPFLSSHGIGYGSVLPLAVFNFASGSCWSTAFITVGVKSGIAEPAARMICLRVKVDDELTIRDIWLHPLVRNSVRPGRGGAYWRLCQTPTADRERFIIERFG